MRTTSSCLTLLLLRVVCVESFYVMYSRSPLVSQRPTILSSTPTSPEPPSDEPDEKETASATPFNVDKPLDPLFVAVTRSDASSSGPASKTVPVPLFGELELDKSLFLFLPVAAFAIGGIGLSVGILLNSGDSFATAIQETSATVQPASVTDACRGICSDPDKSLKALEQFISGIPGK